MRISASDRVYGAIAPAVFRVGRSLARVLGTPADELRALAGDMPAAGGPLLWFHGASAGEMASAVHLAEALRRHGHRFIAAYTTTNRAGMDFVARTAGPDAVVARAPLDHPAWINRALEQWRPQALLLVETELWPNLIRAASQRGVPVFSVSGRIYPRDMAGYRLIRGLTASMLRRLTGILAQSEAERQRFITLGGDPATCVVCGNLKYAVAELTSTDVPPVHDERGPRDLPLVVFGSVHADEIGTVFHALDRLPPGGVRAIIAPRHRSAIDRILREARRRNWVVHRHSSGPPPAGWQVQVLDRVGELAGAYALASVGVVGGGFGRHGGHNPLEAVIAGTPVIFGEHFDHFEPEARALTAAAPDARVADAAELGRRLTEWLSDSTRRRQVLERQRQVLPDGPAIARRYVTALSPWLADSCV